MVVVVVVVAKLVLFISQGRRKGRKETVEESTLRLYNILYINMMLIYNISYSLFQDDCKHKIVYSNHFVLLTEQ